MAKTHMEIDPDQPAAAFWEARYRETTRQTGGRPSGSLERFVAELAPGRALDLGCAKGDDAIWLARRGWHVVAVDISETALGYARENAAAAGMAGRIEFQRHDLAESFPEGSFDLVSAQFLQSPVTFPRERVLAQAAAAVAPGGLLLIAAHASLAPWSWSVPGAVLPTPEEDLTALALDPGDWERVFVGTPEREAAGPDGQCAMVKDGIIVMRRVGGGEA